MAEQWEYKVQPLIEELEERIETIDKDTVLDEDLEKKLSDMLAEYLNEFGNAGWELAAVFDQDGVAIFKRKKEST